MTTTAPRPWQAGARSFGNALARLLTALAGGYLLAAAGAILLARLYPAAREEAVLAGNLLAFLVFAGVVLWAYAARSAWRACLPVWTLYGLTCALTWALSTSSPS